MFTMGMEFEFVANVSTRTVQAEMAVMGMAGTVKYDGSIRAESGYGIEVVSPILSEADVPAYCEQMARLAERVGGRVNDSCGFHVHIAGFERVELHTLKNVARRFANFEDTLDLLQPSNRRASLNQYCLSNAVALATGSRPRQFSNLTVSQIHDGNARIWDAVHKAHSRQALIALFNPSGDSWEPGLRYYKLNLCSLLRHGTIEFRHGSANLGGAEAANLALFYAAFTRVAMEQIRLHKRPAFKTESEAERLRKMFRKVPAPIARAMRERIASHRPATMAQAA